MRLSSVQMVRMSRLLDEALPLDELGRREWLAALGPEQQDIAAALREALLPGSAGTQDALGTLPKVGSNDERDSVSASGLKPGARVGPYELIRPLGAGGMAEVWLARRADGAFKREVALKLPMLTRLRKDLEERFARERDILASLEHPNIARLYDAGTDSNGLPYLSMEYVAGQPITDWCDAHRLGIPERLNLLLQVLEGVQYAHERHVIHRDLKPSNILVTETGQVRLLDFGIAKLLQTEEADRTRLTSVYGRALTPDYASPELIRCDAVDARSDVYSLGILLYELLSGVRAYHLKSAVSAGMVEQAIATLDLLRPSLRLGKDAHLARATTQGKLARQVRGDLDAIVLKGLSKDPEQRYLSAESMADDLRLHLQGQTIRARPPRATYWLHKYFLRHRTGVGLVVLTAVAIGALGWRASHPPKEALRRETTEATAAKRLSVEGGVRSTGPFHRRVALREHERRCEPGIFLGRNHRGAAKFPVSLQ
jgi:serine/threonine protein kinase